MSRSIHYVACSGLVRTECNRDASAATTTTIAAEVTCRLCRRVMARAEAAARQASVTRLAAAWARRPELRLGALISEALVAHGIDSGISHLEDERLLLYVERYVSGGFTAP